MSGTNGNIYTYVDRNMSNKMIQWQRNCAEHTVDHVDYVCMYMMYNIT